MSNTSKCTLAPPQLCLITDTDRPGLITAIEAALEAGVTMVQLRGHHLVGREFYELARQLRPRCREHQAAFIVNDRLDIGLAVGADGYQLGTRSFPPGVARSLTGTGAWLGASVHSLEEARAAVAGGADFLLAGTIFTSRSHPGEPSNGPALLSTLKQALPAYPLLAIGGINSSNTRQVREAGADGIAVISAILDAPDIAQAVHELRHALARKNEGNT